MNTSVCPDQDKLSGYLMGIVAEADAEAIASHVAECDQCEATVRAMEENLSDTVISALRQPRAADAYEDEPDCRRALGNLRAARSASSAADSAGSAPQSAKRTRRIRRLGDYRLMEKLGEGGMGAVYRAEHIKLKRIVALKVLPKGRWKDDQAIARFEREMEAIGRLDHSHIVRAMDAREIQGIRFLVMEFVEGLDLSELVRRGGPLPVADACELIRQAALGLQYSHQHGLVHRDIKPSNLMLTTAGQIKVLDLGLARMQETKYPEEELTGTGQVMGTADYMSPEQALETRTVDIRTDVYSLGCTLYKLLAGHPPFGRAEYDTPLKKLMGHARDPVPPIRQLRAEVPEALAAVIERMLAKEPDGRFATPAEAGNALAPFCKRCDLPGLLRKAGQAPQPMAGIASPETNTEQQQASSYTGTDAEGSQEPVPPKRAPAAPGQFDPYHRWLGIPPKEQPPHHYRLLGIGLFEDDAEVIRDAVARQMAHVRTYHLGGHAELSQTILNELARAKACLLDGKKKAAYDARLRKKLPSESTGRTIPPKAPPKAPPQTPPALPPKPKSLDSGLPALSEQAPQHFASVRSRLGPKRAPARARIAKRFAGIRSRLAGKAPPARVWIATGAAAAALVLFCAVVLHITTNKGTIKIMLSDPTVDVQIKVDGDKVEISGLDQPLRLRVGEHGLEVTGKNFETFTKSFSVRRGENPILQVELVPRTPTAVASGVPPPPGGEFSIFKGHTGPVTCVAFTPDGRLAVSGSKDNTVRVWDVATGKEVRCFLGHSAKVECVAVSPDGERVFSEAGDLLILWELDTLREVRRFKVSSRGGIQMRRVAFSPDGRRAVYNGILGGKTDGDLFLIDLTSGRQLGRLAAGDLVGDSVTAIAFSADGRQLFCGCWDATIRVVDVETMSEVRRFKIHKGVVTGIALSEDGRLAVSGSWDQTARVWKVASGEETACLQGKAPWITGVAISADGRRALSCSADPEPTRNAIVHLLDVPTGAEVASHKQHLSKVLCVAISPDGRRAISGSEDKTLCLWRLPEQDGGGWRPLFNGKTLDGWNGSYTHYIVEDGKLVSKFGPRVYEYHEGGNLLTTEEYGDFILRFDFKIEPGARSGVLIRAPQSGFLSRTGMEIQILDDSNPDRPGLKANRPWLPTGSISGVVASKLGLQKPAGQWNSMEVACRGRGVKITLNGTQILDADLDKLAENPADRESHPGLSQEKGHIGFWGHFSRGRVEYRNIRIKDLGQDTST